MLVPFPISVGFVSHAAPAQPCHCSSLPASSYFTCQCQSGGSDVTELGSPIVRSILVSIGVFALAVMSSSLPANAQVTVMHVRVTVSPAPGSTASVTAIYCDMGTPCAGGV